MSRYAEQVGAAIRAVTVLSSTRIAWFEQASPALPRRTLRALDAEAKRAHLVGQLRQSLYQGFYRTGAPVRDMARTARLAHSPELVAELSRANAGRGCWSAGWLVRAVEGTSVVSERDGLRLKAPAGSWRASPAAPVGVGATVELLTPKEQLGFSPGFYLAQSDVELDLRDAVDLVRVYWHATPRGALLLMASLTRSLNGLGLAFRFKVVAHPDGYGRCDAAVLYLEQNDFERAAPALVRALGLAASELEPLVPAFTRRLAPGVALAEDPGAAESFGWHRCGMLAEAVVAAHEHGVDDLSGRVERVRRVFAEAGVSLEVPYLNAGSADRYILA